MKRIVLGLQYDGNFWHGWQTQPDGHTVQDRLEAALASFTQQPLATICAGRTDRGVHALEQVVHFDTELEREEFSWVRGLNALLPPSIAVRWARCGLEAGDGAPFFHARFSARDRSYRYVLYNDPVRSPLMVGRAGWVFRPLAVDAMQAAAQHLLGAHDFSAFRSSECQANSPVRTMHELGIERHAQTIVFSLRANAFLHHMVRNIVGSLVLVGSGKRSPDWLAQVLQGRDRALAAPTFMPDGLYLAKVDYDPKWKLPQEAAASFPW